MTPPPLPLSLDTHLEILKENYPSFQNSTYIPVPGLIPL